MHILMVFISVILFNHNEVLTSLPNILLNHIYKHFQSKETCSRLPPWLRWALASGHLLQSDLKPLRTPEPTTAFSTTDQL